MKIYIQRVATQQFVGADHRWVSSIFDARNFHNSIRALDFCLAHGLSAVQIRTRFDNTSRDVVWRVADVTEPVAVEA
jgi:hypothetical protein